ncbi:PDZ domain-containing protein [Flavobacterium amnicola]|uniref:PDZ domain-containing protein n=1 Tax=Flavobacterium amnicola TaxID=2506422 RepID=A0A4Q1K381_9FLAO|nr:aspartyl protease family protein [Flavobacterium amnicola]RXR19219.1 PDZ domain-containing protein [Flavobacterium amnicola]
MNLLYHCALLLFSSLLFSQSHFRFANEGKKASIPFIESNHLVIIPVNLNGANLNFLLDTGVENTVLFSLDETDSINFDNIEKIKIKGLGSGEAIDALKSSKNKLIIKNYVDLEHEVYIILDENINFSSQLGIPVHGIIGYTFFKENLVEINYAKKRVYVYPHEAKSTSKRLKKRTSIPITLEAQKPYVSLISVLNNEKIETKMLIDTGNSDAIWLFEDTKIKAPSLFFDDFLGRGFSGDIFGKRARLESLEIQDFVIQQPTVSFPNEASLFGVNFVNNRKGSLGSGVLRRFNVVYDYKNEKIFLDKNSNFNDPFNYNMSGMELEHSGMQYVEEKVELFTNVLQIDVSATDLPTKFKYNFSLKPVLVVLSVRPDSPAALAGIKKGDELKKINGTLAYKYKLYEINQILQSEEGKWVTIEYERNNKLFKAKIQLKKIL